MIFQEFHLQAVAAAVTDTVEERRPPNLDGVSIIHESAGKLQNSHLFVCTQSLPGICAQANGTGIA